MAKEKFQLVSNEVLKRDEIEYKIKNGELTRDDYNLLPSEEKNYVVEILFDMYAQNIKTHPALSALEFTVFALAKLFFKSIQANGLNEKELEFFNSFKELVESHKMTLDVDDWFFSYLTNQKEHVEHNRTEYKNVKVEITGKF